VVQVSVPTAVVSSPTTPVRYSFTLPAGYRLVRLPRVRVTDQAGKETEFFSMFLLGAAPTWSGYRDLHTQSYAAGTYLVTVEVDYASPDGTGRTVVAPAAAMTVPLSRTPPVAAPAP
jgi:hypothetical protein